MKRILTLALAALLLASLFVLPTAAEDDKLTYGTEEVALTLITDMSGEGTVDGFGGLGHATYGDGVLKLETSLNMFDAYGMDGDAFKAAGVLTGAKYIVLAVKNNSDGDFYFCFQPGVNGANIFISGKLAKENPVLLLSKKNKLTNAKFSAERAVNGRDGFLIPQDFEGHIFIPVAILADLNSLGTPYFGGDAELIGSGYHTYPDDATYIELLIDAIYTCGELPEFKTGEQPTEAQTSAVTEPVTEAPTESATEAQTQPVTEAVTNAATEAGSEAETQAVTQAPAGDVTATETVIDTVPSGCSSVVGASALILLLAAALICGKKH